MAWTLPATWSSAQLMTPVLLNTHIRDNLLWLKTRPFNTLDLVGGQTTTSTTFVEMASSTVSLTSTGGNVTIELTGAAYDSALFAILLDIAIDDVRQGDTTNGLTGNSSAFASSRFNIACTFMTITPPSAGSHQYSVYWLVGAGTATLQWGKLWVWETH